MKSEGSGVKTTHHQTCLSHSVAELQLDSLAGLICRGLAPVRLLSQVSLYFSASKKLKNKSMKLRKGKAKLVVRFDEEARRYSNTIRKSLSVVFVRFLDKTYIADCLIRSFSAFHVLAGTI